MGNEIKNLLTNLKIEGFIEIFESKSYIKLQITSLAFCLKEKKHFSWMTIIFIDVYSYLIILLKLYINVHIYSSGQKFPDSSFHNWKNATNFVVSIRMKFISILCRHSFRSNHCCIPTKHKFYKTFYQVRWYAVSFSFQLYKSVLLKWFY